MVKLGMFCSLALAAVFAASMLVSPAEAADPCKRTEFKTDFVKAACAKGGQAEAKDQMKQFMKDHKFKSCNQCHSKLAPDYDLKPDGLDQFNNALKAK